jgi:hypothetical protein
MTNQTAPLSWEVYVSPVWPIVSHDSPLNGRPWTWSPTSATLISGERDAVLVDPLLTIADADALIEWIAAPSQIPIECAGGGPGW